MARSKKETTDEDKPKTLGLFDHLNQVQSIQDPNYFKKISEGDKKSWSSWMINRCLSMVPEYIEYINEIQHLSRVVTDEEYYRVLIGIIPKKRIYSPFPKSIGDKMPKPVMLFLASHFKCSTREINDYLNVLNENDIKSIYYLYGYDEKKVKKILTNK